MKDSIVSEIRKRKWFRWGERGAGVRLVEHWVICARHFRRIFGVDFPDQIFVIRDEIAEGYLDNGQLAVCNNALLALVDSSSFYEMYEKKVIPEFRSFLSFCKSLRRVKKSTPKGRLLALYDKYVEKEDIFTNFLWIIFIIDDYFTKELEQRLKEYLKGSEAEYQDALGTILSPSRKTAIVNQKLDILALVNDMKSRLPKIEVNKRLSDIASKYAYFSTLNMDERPLDIAYYEDELDVIQKKEGIDIEIAKIKNKFKDNKYRFDILMKKLGRNSSLAKIAYACHKICYYRDYRNDLRRECYYNAAFMYREISRRLDINLSQLLFMDRHEIRKSLVDGKLAVQPKDIKGRMRQSIVCWINGRPSYIYEDVEIKDILDIFETTSDIHEFSGLGASPGRLVGKVKIVQSTHKDSWKFEPGDILVTSMTNLDFVPLMSKASAIVTDEGSLLCHAAIISREMKKPCIVGTRLATRLLKDNDMVEIDAEKGIVRIIR